MKENEEDLDVFYKTWKARTENVIIQKYDSFRRDPAGPHGRGPSPLKRFPCWHLKRDMAILMDGTVPLCREDIRVATPLGNALEEDLSVIWEGRCPCTALTSTESTPAMCARCDEYYTYNY